VSCIFDELSVITTSVPADPCAFVSNAIRSLGPCPLQADADGENRMPARENECAPTLRAWLRIAIGSEPSRSVRFCRPWLGALAPHEHVPDLVSERIRQAGLQQKSVAPGIGRLLLRRSQRVAGQHDDARILRSGVAAEPTSKVQSRDSRQRHVRHDDVRVELACAREPIIGVLCRNGLKPHCEETEGVHRQRILVIVDEQYDGRFRMQAAPPV